MISAKPLTSAEGALGSELRYCMQSAYFGVFLHVCCIRLASFGWIFLHSVTTKVVHTMRMRNANGFNIVMFLRMEKGGSNTNFARSKEE
jgi:hypothetical protein